MSMATINMDEREYKRIIDIKIHPVLDESYIHLNHIKMIVSILLYIFGLRIIEGQILSPEVLSLKNKIIKLIENFDVLIDNFDEIQMIIEYSEFIFGNYQGIHHFISEIYIKYYPKEKIIIDSKVRYILYKMIRIFIYDRDLLFPFTNHNQAKNTYLIKYNYVLKDYVFKHNFNVFSNFKTKFINKFFELFDNLDKLIDKFKLDAIFELKYSCLYELTDIAIENMTQMKSYTKHDYTAKFYSKRTLLNIKNSYLEYYIAISDYISIIKNMNNTLQDKLDLFNMELKSIDITIESIDKIAQVVDNLVKLNVKLLNLSKNININFYKHIKVILQKSTVLGIEKMFNDSFTRYRDTIDDLEREFISYNL